MFSCASVNFLELHFGHFLSTVLLEINFSQDFNCMICVLVAKGISFTFFALERSVQL